MFQFHEITLRSTAWFHLYCACAGLQKVLQTKWLWWLLGCRSFKLGRIQGQKNPFSSVLNPVTLICCLKKYNKFCFAHLVVSQERNELPFPKKRPCLESPWISAIYKSWHLFSSENGLENILHIKCDLLTRILGQFHKSRNGLYITTTWRRKLL